MGGHSSAAPVEDNKAAPSADELAKKFLKKKEDLEVDKIFRALVKLEGSDLHLKVGRPPMIRVKGSLRPMNRGPIDDEEMIRLLFPMMEDRHRKIFERDGGADFAYFCDCDGVNWRFRVNLLTQLGHVGMVARRINNKIPPFEGLFLPPVIETLCKFDQGMVLLAGVTGSGKSTTIACMLNWINAHYRKHILTLEDPIEFIFTEDKCLINQREIGQDVKDFEIGMKHAVREDPDIMLVGEMRDRETFMTAIHAAETGHLVFGTIHAASAPSTIGRILDLFPPEMHRALRSAMAFNMKGIVSQKLLKSMQAGRFASADRGDHDLHAHDSQTDPGGKGLEVGRRHSHVGAGRHAGFHDEFVRLGRKDLIDRDTAIEVAPNVDALKMALKGIAVSTPGIL